MQRIDKILSDANVASRKELKELIRAGRVTVNGTVVRRPEEKADELADEICVDNVPVRKKRRMVVMLHKPAGYVTSTEDPRDATVMELIPEAYRMMDLAPAGRLDKETEGLLILTNDGLLAHRLISPKHRVEKVYYAEHTGTAGQDDIAAFAAGLTLADGLHCLPAKLEPLGAGSSLVTVMEGKYHQIRRMLASRGMHVSYLKRIKEGGLSLGDLPKGTLRELDSAEIVALFPENAEKTVKNA